MENIPQIIANTLENEIGTDQLDVFISHLRYILFTYDQKGKSIVLTLFLKIQSEKNLELFQKFVKSLERPSSKDEPIFIDLCGTCYSNGIGVEKDPGKAFQLFSKAAKFDYYRAVFNFALCN
jgi:hypothetical protein